MSGFGFGGKEEEADSGGFDGGGGGGGGAVVLVDHVLEVLVGGDGDEGIEVLVGELVLEREGSSVQESFREAHGEVCE